MVAFGAAYAFASLSCTLAVLLSVIAQALATDNLAQLVAVFAAYAAGAATLLMALALSAAFAKQGLTAKVRGVLSPPQRRRSVSCPPGLRMSWGELRRRRYPMSRAHRTERVGSCGSRPRRISSPSLCGRGLGRVRPLAPGSIALPGQWPS
jgi:hypothetical protein